MAHPDTSWRHLQFIYASLQQMQKKLSKLEIPLLIMESEAVDAFEILSKSFEIKHVFSHRESGIRLSWERDKAVAKQLKEKHILWDEFQQNGVLRGITNRQGWDKAWYSYMNQPIIQK